MLATLDASTAPTARLFLSALCPASPHRLPAVLFSSLHIIFHSKFVVLRRSVSPCPFCLREVSPLLCAVSLQSAALHHPSRLWARQRRLRELAWSHERHAQDHGAQVHCRRPRSSVALLRDSFTASCSRISVVSRQCYEIGLRSTRTSKSVTARFVSVATAVQATSLQAVTC